MAKCPKCSTRKAKRACPALGAEICPPCCAENRLVSIPCPRDCPHLQGEFYQHRRRQERATARGRDFLALQERLFPDEIARGFAFRLMADIYYFTRESGPLDDAAMAAGLGVLKGSLSKIFVPPDGASPLGRFLVERMADRRRYPDAPGMGAEERRRAVGAIEGHVRSLARAGGRQFQDLLSSFFDALDFEADLDYSPADAGEGPAAAPGGPRRSPGGLILPPGV